MRYALTLLAVVSCRALPDTDVDSGDRPPTIAAKTAGMRSIPGFVPLFMDELEGRLHAVLPVEGELLYAVSLPGGLGSNDVGLDRGQVGDRKLVRVRRAGPRVLLVQPNLAWRSSSLEAAVQRAASESFAESVLYGFDVEAEGTGSVLVDATDFFLRDAHRVAARISSAGEGSFELDASRSALVDGEGFPDNSIVDVLLTFKGDDPGPELFTTAPDPRSVSLRVRHSFIRLPDPGYRPRPFHPKSGFFEHAWRDLSAPIDESVLQHVITRHRLEKLYPDRASSPPVEPIVYHVDRGAPEPVRTALLEGARYWEPVFEAAGFEGGYRVELLPEGADPHDARYNVIQWVNRSTRGWSYGDSIIDPRTGEILKGHVTLGALRVRQDVLLAEGLVSPYEDGDDPRPVAMALARIRQLAAHEVGHTLGLAHNFAASTYGRASVMDYPAPLVTVGVDGGVDLSDAYRDGCGDWDEAAIRYGYTDFAHLDARSRDRNEARGLAELLVEIEQRGLEYLTDRDARGPDRAHPLANLWDNGSDPVEHFQVELDVRAAALERFSEAAVKEGRPLAELEDVLVPVYLHHRYQLEAAVRSLGGVEYGYAVRGEGEGGGVTSAPAPVQRRVLELVMRTLRREFLELPAGLAERIPPRPPGSPGGRERFVSDALLFDPLEAAAASIEITLDLLLDPARAARLVDQGLRDPAQPSFDDVLEALLDLGWGSGERDFDTGGGPALQIELRFHVARHLMELSADEEAPARVREPAHAALIRIAEVSGEGALLVDVIRRFREDPGIVSEIEAPRVPPGSPIGCGGNESR